MIKVSIIIPVFNAEQYLDNCIQSIVNQTFTNIEIILINDGSTDRSIDIIEAWKKKDARISCINQKNQGVTCARKNGVKAASGEWITFVDADDELPTNAIELMIIASKNNDVVIGHILIDHAWWNFPQYNSTWSQKKYMHDLLVKRSIHWGPVAKLIRKSLIDEFIFDISPKITNGEDFIFNIRIATKTNKIRIINNDVYHYIYRPNSAISNNPYKSIRYCFLYEKEVWKSFRGIHAKYFMDYCLRTLKTIYLRLKMIVKGRIELFCKAFSTTNNINN
ncbi:glycosyltransferase family 2 protein [Fibrobacter sp.]|uniref:glycosyltransferase family 2 protein n=1 Tax=Fibrobacter sp. TaxID=35828 RepID=UPI00386F37EC